MVKIIGSSNISMLPSCEIEELEQRMEMMIVPVASDIVGLACDFDRECDDYETCPGKCDPDIPKCDDHSCDDN